MVTSEDNIWWGVVSRLRRALCLVKKACRLQMHAFAGGNERTRRSHMHLTIMAVRSIVLHSTL